MPINSNSSRTHCDQAEEIELVCSKDAGSLPCSERDDDCDIEPDVWHLGSRPCQLGRRHVGHSSWLTASGHLVTVTIGAGVLSLPSAMSWLGWIGGITCLLLFYSISLWCSLMLARVYKVNGRRHPTYSAAVLAILGRRDSRVLAVVQRVMLCLAAVGYTIAAADSMTYLAAASCGAGGSSVQGHCGHMQKQWQMTLLFGGVQVALSLLPDLESVWLVSALGAAMSLGYSLLTIGLGASQAHNGLGSLWGRTAAIPSVRVFSVFNALGQIAFAYGCAVVQLEVQDTLREPPDAEASMRKAVTASISTAFILYLLVSVLCYLALGDAAHPMVLTSFSSTATGGGGAPWATVLGNVLVLLHMFAAFQVFCQPMFGAIEEGVARSWPRLDAWVQNEEKGGRRQRRRVQVVRLCYRGVYVGLITLVAALFPFFGAFIGLIGSVAFYPLAVYFPIKMFSAIYSPTQLQLSIMLAVNVLTAVLSVAAAAGSLADIVRSADTQYSVG